jgi:hypothetical protein
MNGNREYVLLFLGRLGSFLSKIIVGVIHNINRTFLFVDELFSVV